MRRRPLLLSALLALVGTVSGLVTTVGPAQAVEVTLVLDGRGNGHGVGLSQWGAYGYAVDLGWPSAQILDHYYGGTVAATVPSTTAVRVRLQNLDGLQTAVAVDSGSLVVAGLAGGPWRSVLVRETATNGIYSVWARADTTRCPSSTGDPATAGWSLVNGSVSTKVEIRTAADSTTVSTTAQLLSTCEPSGTVRWYRGTIRALVDGTGVPRTVNELPLEQYLRTVIAMEMSPGWADDGGGRGAQALRAQAVAARSYALAYPAASTPSTYSDVCDMVCQSYFGVAYRVSGGTVRQVEATATDAAVLATAGVVRRVGTTSGAVALTMYSASNGGYTAANAHPLTPFPAVADAGDATALNPNHSWSVSLTGASISSRYPAIGTFTGLTVTARNGFGEWGGRVMKLTLAGSAGSVSVSGADFRSRMRLKDTWFTVRGASSPSAPPPPTTLCGSRVAPSPTGALGPAAAARFTPRAPRRIVDTRIGLGTERLALRGGCTMVVRTGLPASVTSIVVNVAAVRPKSSGYVVPYACGTSRPPTSALQAVAGRVIASTGVVRLAVDGSFCIYSSTTTELIADLFGTYSSTSGVRYQPIPTARVYDSRRATPVPANSVVRVKVGGSAKVPAGATAVALTVHGLSAASDGYVTAYPCTAARPTTSALNTTRGIFGTNHVQVALSTAGELCLYVNAAMHITVDVSGWFGAAATTQYVAMTPTRVVDTRKNLGLSGGFSAGANRPLTLASKAGLPSTATLKAVMAQVTAVGASSTGWLTVHPCQSPVPSVSMVRYVAGNAAATSVVGADDASGRWCIAASAPVHVLVDVSGWFA